jgi:chromosome segregation ATPase
LAIEASAAEAAAASGRSVNEARAAASADLNHAKAELEQRIAAAAHDAATNQEREAAASAAQALADARAQDAAAALGGLAAALAEEAAGLASLQASVAVLFADHHHHDRHVGERRARLEAHHCDDVAAAPPWHQAKDAAGQVEALVAQAKDAMHHPLADAATVGAGAWAVALAS